MSMEVSWRISCRPARSSDDTGSSNLCGCRKLGHATHLRIRGMRLALTEQCQPAAGLASADRIGPKRRTRHGKEAADHRLAQNKPDIEVRPRRGPQVPNPRLTPGPVPEIGSGAARAKDRPSHHAHVRYAAT